MTMPRPKKEAPVDASGANGNGPRTHADTEAAPSVVWLSLVKTKGGYAVLKATTVGKELDGVEVLHGPLGRTAASAALRTEMARAFLLGRGPT